MPDNILTKSQNFHGSFTFHTNYGCKLGRVGKSGRFSGKCSFSSALLSASELAVGDVCKITVGDKQEQLTIDNVQASGFAPAGMFGGMRGGRHGDGMSGSLEPTDKKDMRPSKDAASFEKREIPGNFSDRRAMQEDISTSGISADALTLTGISVVVLLFGLLIAVKIKH